MYSRAGNGTADMAMAMAVLVFVRKKIMCCLGI